MKLARLLSPDWKIVVGVVAAMYGVAVFSAFLPELSPGGVAGKLKPAK